MLLLVYLCSKLWFEATSCGGWFAFDSTQESDSTQEIIEKYILTLNHHTFHVNLMTMTIDSFDIIIGMDWLSIHWVEILCYEKVIWCSLPNEESLTIYGDKPSKIL